MKHSRSPFVLREKIVLWMVRWLNGVGQGEMLPTHVGFLGSQENSWSNLQQELQRGNDDQ
jgi:hypothetical protein